MSGVAEDLYDDGYRDGYANALKKVVEIAAAAGANEAETAILARESADAIDVSKLPHMHPLARQARGELEPGGYTPADGPAPADDATGEEGEGDQGPLPEDTDSDGDAEGNGDWGAGPEGAVAPSAAGGSPEALLRSYGAQGPGGDEDAQPAADDAQPSPAPSGPDEGTAGS